MLFALFTLASGLSERACRAGGLRRDRPQPSEDALQRHRLIGGTRFYVVVAPNAAVAVASTSRAPLRSSVSHSPDADDFIVTEWRAALKDAGVNEADFYLITCPGAAVTGSAKAVSFEQGQVLYGYDDEGGVVVQQDKLAEANDNQNLYRDRIAVYEDVDPGDEVELAKLAGLLRHELEHPHQRALAPEAFALKDLVEKVAAHVADGDDDRYREIINEWPLEADANAAASAFIRKRYPNAVGPLLLGPDRYLVATTEAPGDPKTLVERTVDFLWQFRDVCNDPQNLQQGRTFADILDNRIPGGNAGARWRQLMKPGERGS